MGWRRLVLRVGAGMAVVFVAMQLVPYGWRHPNPPVEVERTWPSAEAEELFRGACADCHSNETDWPVYAYVAPMSWLVRKDVEDGRDAMNLSERDPGELDEAADAIEDGSMPPRQYEPLHPDARLSTAEEQVLIDAFDALEDAADDDERDDEDNSGPG